MKLNVTKNFNLKNISLDLSRELNIGLDMIAIDIERGIEKGAQFGKPFKSNEESTINKKGFDHPLLETGSMKNSAKMERDPATKKNQVATLSPSDDNIKKVEYNNWGTKKIPARPFWGISKKVEKKILTLVAQRLEGRIRNA